MTNIYERIAQDMLERQERLLDGNPPSENVYNRLADARLIDLEDITARKQNQAAQRRADKIRKYDPNYREFNPDEWERAIDGDTLIHKTERLPDGRPLSMRLGLPQGHSYDTFETRKWDAKRGEWTDPYTRNPNRAFHHRVAFAKQFGKDLHDVTNEDLYMAGDAQFQALSDNLESLRGQPYYLNRGGGHYGRAIGEFEDPRAFDPISQGAHAGYYSNFNVARRLQDRADPDQRYKFYRPEETNFAEDVGDFFVGLATGGVSMAGPLTQGAMLMKFQGQLPEEINSAFRQVQELNRQADEFLGSDLRTYQKTVRQKEYEVITKPLFQYRKQKLEKAGMAKPLAWANAMAMEYGDALRNIVEEPERLVDLTAESLLYTLGVGTIGKSVAMSVQKHLARDTLRNLIHKRAKSPFEARQIAARYLGSKAAKKRVDAATRRAGITTVGVTEGLMNAAGAYAQVAELTPDQLANSEAYQALIKRGLTHEQARANLAKKTFNTVGLINTALAAFAAKWTGAGNWEANILRNFTNQQKRSLGQKVKGFAQETGLAAGREFLEESQQSGGGELAVQYGLHPITGEPIGPGVGRITAEGGLSGALSAGTLAQIRNVKEGAGKLAVKGLDAVNQFAGAKLSEQRQVIAAESDVREAIRVVGENVDEDDIGWAGALTYIEEYLDEAERNNTDGVVSPRLWGELEVFVTAYQQYLNNPNTEITQGEHEQWADLKKQVGLYKDEYIEAVKQEASWLAQRVRKGHMSLDDITDAQLRIIRQAEKNVAKYNFLNEVRGEDKQEAPSAREEEIDDYLSSARNFHEAVDDMEEWSRNSETAGEPGVSGRKAVSQVREEKMGHGVRKVGNRLLYGLAALEQMVTNAVENQDKDAYTEADTRLAMFLDSQAKKYRAYAALVEAMTPLRSKQRKELQSEIEARVNEESLWSGKVHWDGDNTIRLVAEMHEELQLLYKVRRNAARYALHNEMVDEAYVEQVSNIPYFGVTIPNFVLPEAVTAAEELIQEANASAQFDNEMDPELANVTSAGEDRPAKAIINKKFREQLPKMSNTMLARLMKVKLDKLADLSLDEELRGIIHSEASAIQEEYRRRTGEPLAETTETAPAYQSLEDRGIIVERVESEDPRYSLFQARDENGNLVAQAEIDIELNRARSVRVFGEKGKGTANALYDTIEQQLGITLKPSPRLTKSGYRLWKRRNPALVADINEDDLFLELAGDASSRQQTIGEQQAAIKEEIAQLLAANPDISEEDFLKNAAELKRKYPLTSPVYLLKKAYKEKPDKPPTEDEDENTSTEGRKDRFQAVPGGVRGVGFAERAKRGISTLRKVGTIKHFGNPFGVLGIQTSAERPNFGTVTEVVQAYRDWLLGTAHRDVAQERRQWILEQIDSGVLDDATLLYYKDTPVNHARALNDIINERETFIPEAFENDRLAAEEATRETQEAEEETVEEETFEDENEQALIEATETLVSDETGKASLSSKVNSRLQRTVSYLTDRVSKNLSRLVGTFANPDGGTASWPNKKDDKGLTKLDKVKQRIQARFVQMGLPYAVALVLQSRDNNTRNILNAVDRVMSSFNKDAVIDKFYELIKADETEQKSFEAVLDFVSDYTGELTNIYLGLIEDKENSNSPFRSNNLGDKGSAVEETLKRYLFAFLLEDNTVDGRPMGTINESFVMAMGLEMGNWLVGAGSSTLNKEDWSINRFLGRHDKTPLTNAEREKYGNGIPLRAIAQQLGDNFLDSLNVQLNTEGQEHIGQDFRKRLGLSVGLMMLSAAATSRWIEIKTVNVKNDSFVEQVNMVTFETLEGMVGKDTDNLNLVYLLPRAMEKLDRDPEAELWPSDEFSEAEKIKELRDNYNGAKRILKDFFGVQREDRVPLDEAPTEGPSRIRGRFGRVPKKLKEFLLNSSKHPFRPIDPMVSELKRWGDEEAFLEEVLGQIPTEVINQIIHTEEAKSIEAKNARNRRSLGYVLDRLNEHGKAEMFFEYNVASQHRAMMDSNTINPQNDKLHRVLFGMEEWALTIPTKISLEKSLTDENGNPMYSAEQAAYVSFLVSLALAWDIKVDTLHVEDKVVGNQTVPGILSQLEDKLKLQSVKDAIAIMRIPEEELENGKYSSEQMKTIGKAITDLNDGERAHAWAGLRAYADFRHAKQGKKKNVTVVLPMEADGKTNGFASLLMQIVPNDRFQIARLKALYSGVGMFFETSKFRNYPDFALDGGQDNYLNVSQAADIYSQQMLRGRVPPLDLDLPVTSFAQAQERKQLIDTAITTGDWRDWQALKDYDAHIKAGNRQFQLNHATTVASMGFLEFVRNFAKGPLTQTAYRAGMNSIRKGVKREALREFYSQLAKAGESSIVHGVDEEGNPLMSEEEKIAIGSQALADVMHRFYTIAYSLHNSDPENVPRQIRSVDEMAAQYRDIFATYEELVFYRRTLYTDASKWMKNERGALEKRDEFFTIEDEQLVNFQNGIDLIFGHALQAALEDKLKHITPMTNYINDAVYMMNLIFTEKFKELIRETEEAEGREATEEDRRRILNQMVKRGLVPMVKTPLSESQLDGLELTNYGTVTLKDGDTRAYFNQEQPIRELFVDQDGNTSWPGTQSSLRSDLKGIEPNMNIGVAAIAKAIHSSDSAVNGQIMSDHPILNLFDATYGNPADSIKTTIDSNRVFYETHRDWDFPAEVGKALQEFILLLDPKNSQLGAVSKAVILSEFRTQRAKFAPKDLKERLENATDLDHWDGWLQDFTEAIANNTAGRKKLYEDFIVFSNQFAGEGTEYQVPRQGMPESTLVQNISWTGGLVEAIRASLNRGGEHAKLQAEEAIARAYAEGENPRLQTFYHPSGNKVYTMTTINDAVNEYLANAPSGENVLDVIYAVMYPRLKDGDREQFRRLINKIRPMLRLHQGEQYRGVYVVLEDPGHMGEDNARYYWKTGAIKVSKAAENPLIDILHELVHAATFRNIESMDPKSPAYQQMLKEAKAFAEKYRTDSRRTRRKVAMVLRSEQYAKNIHNLPKEEFQRRKHNRMIAEYVAYMTSTISKLKGSDQFAIYFEYVNETRFINDLANVSLTPPEGLNRIYYSNLEEVDDSLFISRTEHELTRESMLRVFEILRNNENVPVDPETQQLFNTILDKFIAPGLESIDGLIMKIAESPDAMRNVGRLLEQDGKQQAHIQASQQNYFSSPLDMHLQEVAMHEIAHAIFEAVLGVDAQHPGHVGIQKSVEKFFEHTLDQIVEKYGEDKAWMVFLPDERNYTGIDEARAKERYRHIFETMDYAEFMAMAVTNPQFIKILQTLDNVPEKPIFEGKLVSWLFSLFERALILLRGAIFQSSPHNMHEEMTRLAARAVRINNRQRRRAEKKRISTQLKTGWLDPVAEDALLKLAWLTNEQLKKVAARYSLTGEELSAEMQELGKLAGTLIAFRSAAASAAITDMRRFYEAYQEAVGRQDNLFSQLMAELMPTAEHNRKWIEFLLASEKAIDQPKQQTFEHSRSILKSMYENYDELSVGQREALTRVMLSADLQALTRGDIRMSYREILDMISDENLLDQKIAVLETALEATEQRIYVEMFNKQSVGLANLMTDASEWEWHQQTNVDNIVAQLNLRHNLRRERPEEQHLKEILEHLTSLRALKRIDPTQRRIASVIYERELARGVQDNGFTGTLGLAAAFVDQSRALLFSDDTTQMHKGHVAIIFDEETATVAKPIPDGENGLDLLIAEMESQRYKYVETLARDALDENRNIQLALFKTDRGISTYSKAGFSLTAEQARGTGMLENAFASVSGSQAVQVTAAEAHTAIALTREKAYNMAEYQMRPNVTQRGVKMLPVYAPKQGPNDKQEPRDYRYVMSYRSRKEHLKQREYLDEVLPHMLANVKDKLGTKTINREGVDMLYEEWLHAQNDPDLAAQFVAVGQNVESEEGREMWALLPMDTKIHVQEVFGSNLMYVRSDAVNLILGFRKMSFANNKWLGRTAPLVRMAEKIWQEIIQWERFRIAVLNPIVVTGNMISNIVLLLMQRIPASYIIRGFIEAVQGMRKYQKDVRERNELQALVNKRQALNEDSHHLEMKLARKEQAILVNPVHNLVDMGLFTSIVEEFGVDENSTRRKLTTKLMEKVGNITGSRTGVRTFQELFMVPGSETGQVALLATQYGDFIGRYVQFNWHTKERGMSEKEAMHQALDNFIFYNVPQNRLLQAFNDNGGLMFTKFFFRIQRVIIKLFAQNPVHATMYMMMQGYLFNGNATSENITNYALLHNFTGKFKLTPWEHFQDGDIFMPMSLEWLKIFYPD